jgi:hypothetical protein
MQEFLGGSSMPQAWQACSSSHGTDPECAFFGSGEDFNGPGRLHNAADWQA